RTNVWLGATAIALLLFTDALHQLPLAYLGATGTQSQADLFIAIPPEVNARNAVVDFPMLSYLREIRGPINSTQPLVAQYLKPKTWNDAEWVVAVYLKEYAQSNDTVVASYGDLPLQFYTGLKVIGGLQEPFPPLRFSDWHDPEWAFPR